VTSDPVFRAFCKAGLWPGLGPALGDALDEAGIRGPADVSTERLSALPRIGPTRAGRLLSAFVAAAPIYEVVGQLVAAGLDARLAGRAVDAFGPPAPRSLRDDPWLLLSIPGVNPDQADRFGRASLPGVRPDDPRRGRALVAYLLGQEAQHGHTVTPRDTIMPALSSFRVGDPDLAVEAALQSGGVRSVALPDQPPLLALSRLADAETAVARAIGRLVSAAEPIAAKRRRAAVADLDSDQQAAVDAALQVGVSVLTGGPGTGKSRTVAAIVSLGTAAGRSVALAAPTGRAAKRLAELCDAPATTLHRLLGAQPRRGADGVAFGGGFAHNSEAPLDQDLIVIDEVSMLDVELAEALLEACADGTHLVLVGDPAQLPSIGPGRVLGDVIDSRTVPVTELRTLYRQAEGGAIARLATAVRAGSLPPVDDAGREVVLIPVAGAAQAAHRVVQLVTDSIPRALGIPADQVQVVTPIHRSAAGTQALNAALKARLNPGDGKRRFDVGDRVVATANHLEAEPFGYANGEVGVVTVVGSGGAVTVEFASGPAEVSGKALADLLHGWAVTVHRAQGSEFPAVVVVLPAEAGRMLSRPLVYTALTRAQRHLSVVNSAAAAVVRAVREIGALPRRTQLQVAVTTSVPGRGSPVDPVRR
jgi:exodeoxyribonuclease V alpha subunit